MKVLFGQSQSLRCKVVAAPPPKLFAPPLIPCWQICELDLPVVIIIHPVLVKYLWMGSQSTKSRNIVPGSGGSSDTDEFRNLYKYTPRTRSTLSSEWRYWKRLITLNVDLKQPTVHLRVASKYFWTASAHGRVLVGKKWGGKTRQATPQHQTLDSSPDKTTTKTTTKIKQSILAPTSYTIQV